MKSTKPQPAPRPRTRLRLLITGFSMGVADLVPGVSGGSIALLFGIYDELIHSIKLVTGEVLKLLVHGQFIDAYRKIPLQFLVPVFGGIFIAIFGFVRIVEYLLEVYPVYVWAFFFGLIIGTAHIIANRISDWTINRALLLTTGAAIVFFVVGLPAANSESTVVAMFGTGLIAICAMILPGISGSLIMLILGQYENVISAVSELKLQLLISFAAGATVGLALFSRLLSWLLDKYHSATLAFLVGLMIGALRAVWPWRTELSSEIYESYLPGLTSNTLLAVAFIVVGYILVLQLEKIGLAREHDEDLS